MSGRDLSTKYSIQRGISIAHRKTDWWSVLMLLEFVVQIGGLCCWRIHCTVHS
jgi:hypothetical protein